MNIRREHGIFKSFAEKSAAIAAGDPVRALKKLPNEVIL